MFVSCSTCVVHCWIISRIISEVSVFISYSFFCNVCLFLWDDLFLSVANCTSQYALRHWSADLGSAGHVLGLIRLRLISPCCQFDSWSSDRTRAMSWKPSLCQKFVGCSVREHFRLWIVVPGFIHAATTSHGPHQPSIFLSHHVISVPCFLLCYPLALSLIKKNYLTQTCSEAVELLQGPYSLVLSPDQKQSQAHKKHKGSLIWTHATLQLRQARRRFLNLFSAAICFAFRLWVVKLTRNTHLREYETTFSSPSIHKDLSIDRYKMISKVQVLEPSKTLGEI